MTIAVDTFGAQGARQTDLIRITNAGGAHIALIPIGARLVEAHFPDREGRLSDIVLGFETVEDYLDNDTYAGAIAGRYANRIAEGRFTLGDRTYQLDINEGANHVHGGHDGLDRQQWDYDLDHPSNAVKFRHRSPHGHAGYPGELAIEVTYRLGDDDTIDIDMTATTSADTIVNLVNHAYWNLAGHQSGTVLDQTLQVASTMYTPVDDDLLPTGEIRDVEGTPFDFTVPRRIGERIDDVPTSGGAGRIADGTPTGYDHNWVLDGPRQQPHAAVVAVDNESGRRLTLITTEPGVQIYTAGYMHRLAGKAGARYNPGAGFTLETQTFPSSPNIAWFPAATLRPADRYRHRMRLSLDVVPD